jgi:hypothetical protein
MPPPPAASQFPTVPLCVDLDGTIIRTDLLWETLVQLLGRNPLNLFLVPFWWRRGRARLKAELAARTKVDVALLPYYQPLLEYLRAERKVRPIILATASDRALAEQVAGYLDLFTEVMASDGQTNLRGKTKLAALTARFGVRGFDYAGNSSVDLAVWAGARQAIVVGRDSLADQARRRAVELLVAGVVSNTAASPMDQKPADCAAGSRRAQARRIAGSRGFAASIPGFLPRGIRSVRLRSIGAFGRRSPRSRKAAPPVRGGRPGIARRALADPGPARLQCRRRLAPAGIVRPDADDLPGSRGRVFVALETGESGWPHLSGSPLPYSTRSRLLQRNLKPVQQDTQLLRRALDNAR